MSNPGSIENSPLGLVDGTLLTDHQRNDDTSIGLSRQGRENTLTQPAPAILDDMARRPDEGLQTMIPGRRLRVRTHAAGRAYALLQQPYFIIEAMRIGAAMRTPETHGQLPALAGPQIRNGSRRHRIALAERPGRIPGERQSGRNLRRFHALRRNFFHLEIETHTTLEAVRQAIHSAHDRHVATLPSKRQLFIQIVPGIQTTPGKPETHPGER